MNAGAMSGAFPTYFWTKQNSTVRSGWAGLALAPDPGISWIPDSSTRATEERSTQALPTAMCLELPSLPMRNIGCRLLDIQPRRVFDNLAQAMSTAYLKVIKVMARSVSPWGRARLPQVLGL
jgi:hypothetical protein